MWTKSPPPLLPGSSQDTGPCAPRTDRSFISTPVAAADGWDDGDTVMLSLPFGGPPSLPPSPALQAPGRLACSLSCSQEGASSVRLLFLEALLPLCLRTLPFIQLLCVRHVLRGLSASERGAAGFLLHNSSAFSLAPGIA
uniref:Uncharacterized protein n=1 Tax=Myotis myotis TaxID=51298 RepID=A0A7J7T5X4_MYOMY|nr:hypothetical protein mMyoMyo1_009213 [Myotis myotis]